MSFKRIAGGLLMVMLGTGIGTTLAQNYPVKPIRIVTSAAGGGNDFEARLVAQGITDSLGQPLLVDNRSAQVSAEVVMKAPADGYNLLYQSSTLWIAPLLRKMPYDPVADFSPIVSTVRSLNVLVVHPSLPVKSVKELIALAKARPGELNYASSGTGSVTQFSAELFKNMTGANIVHVPYKGTAAAFQSLLSGETQMYVTDVGLLAPHAQTGRARILAITSLEPTALAPGLPTVASTVPGFEAVALSGIWAPAKTPAPIINRLNQEIVRLLNQPEIKERFLKVGAEVVASTPDQLGAAIKTEVAKLSKIIKDAGIKSQ